jgi:hypothetical protein
MSKLIGTDPNQVPSNADLGGAAFMDKKDFLLSKGSEMSAIDAVISNTAVDVFIYDTTKDSDGGAWRKRTQHTSWYNEKLNTTTRGSRKEFPVVAVFVTEAARVTIYDGDDPNMPMWMTFPVTNNSWLKHSGSGGCKAVVARDGIMVTGGDIRGSIVRFIADDGNVFEVGYNYEHQYITTRNTSVGPSTGPISIVNNSVNDVAMTVLPNSPIDADTGLPVPTIAVATDGGVSVIKDDGTVIDYTGSAPYNVAKLVNFTKDHRIRFALESGSGRYYRTYNIGSADRSVNQWDHNQDDGLTLYVNYANGDAVMLGNPIIDATEKAVCTSKGVTFFEENLTTANESLVAHATSSYNTGWMNGDIKLATLSDTDTTNVTGAELVTNGTFDSNTTGWNAGTSTLSQTSGKAKVLSPSGGWVSAYQAITTVVGKLYTISTSVDPTTGGSLNGADVLVQNSSTLGVSSVILIGPVTHGTSATILSGTFTATATTTYIHLRAKAYASNEYTLFDNVTVRLAEADRSVNGNGLQVFGTVTKTAVATGADLVAYSGFSSSNYLRQPYNNDLNFGSGSYSVMGWFKTDATNSTGIITQNGPSDTDENLTVYIAPANYGIYFDYGVSNQYSHFSQATDRALIADTNWHHFVCHVSAGGAPKIYVDGVNKALSISANAPSTFTFDTDYLLNIGNGRGTDNNLPFGGSIALLRISTTVPSPAQIKKIYEDEKFLFQENAKATLYGTSDAVTALAYDDDTELLHVGTSAGRSDFQGLRRINNTTRAIGTAISAVDGFIVEE